MRRQRNSSDSGSAARAARQAPIVRSIGAERAFPPFDPSARSAQSRSMSAGFGTGSDAERRAGRRAKRQNGTERRRMGSTILARPLRRGSRTNTRCRRDRSGSQIRTPASVPPVFDRRLGRERHLREFREHHSQPRRIRPRLRPRAAGPTRRPRPLARAHDARPRQAAPERPRAERGPVREDVRHDSHRLRSPPTRRPRVLSTQLTAQDKTRKITTDEPAQTLRSLPRPVARPFRQFLSRGRGRSEEVRHPGIRARRVSLRAAGGTHLRFRRDRTEADCRLSEGGPGLRTQASPRLRHERMRPVPRVQPRDSRDAVLRGVHQPVHPGVRRRLEWHERVAPRRLQRQPGWRTARHRDPDAGRAHHGSPRAGRDGRAHPKGRRRHSGVLSGALPEDRKVARRAERERLCSGRIRPVRPPRSATQLAPDSGDLLLVAAGDSAALTRLVTRWSQPVYAFFERTREPSAATEAALATFERLVTSSPRYAPDVPFPSFLWGIAVKIVEDGKTGDVLEIPAPKLAESAAARTALVRSAIAALPSAERAAFLLTRVARLPATAAAEALGVPETEVRRRLVRALESLRTSLVPLLESPAAPAPQGEPEDGPTKAAS